jgi:hypothetical protein
MSLMAVVVNCLLLVSLPNAGITAVLPNSMIEGFSNIRLLNPPSDGSSSTGTDETDYKSICITVMAVVAIEHIMLFVKIVLRVAIPDEPSMIKDDEFKERYFCRKEDSEYYERLERQQEKFNLDKAAGQSTGGFGQVIEDMEEDEQEQDISDDVSEMKENEDGVQDITARLEGGFSMKNVLADQGIRKQTR